MDPILDSRSKAIVTKTVASGSTPTRIIASDMDCTSVAVTWDHSLSTFANHANAAAALREKMDWATGTLVGGEMGADQYAFVFLPKD